MEGLLTTSYKSSDKREEKDILVEIKKPERSLSKPFFKVSTPSEALEVLKNEPDHESLVSTLRFLKEDSSDFSITSPSPLAAQLVHVLVSDIVPNYWGLLFSGSKSRKKGSNSKKASDIELLLSCFRSITGLNALLLNLKQFCEQSKNTKKAVGGPNIHDVLTILLQVLSELLQGDETVDDISKSIWNTSAPSIKQKAICNEFLSIVGSGKILGLAAEAEDVVNDLSKQVGEKYWISDGAAYSGWLARNITHMARTMPALADNGWKFCSELLCKAFRLGYTGKAALNTSGLGSNIPVENILKEVVTSLLLQRQNHSTQFERLLNSLPAFEQRNFINSLVKLISRDYLSSIITSEDDSRWWQSDASIVSAAAGLIKLVIGNEASRKSHLMTWLTSTLGAGVGDGIAIRRAVLAALSVDKNDIETVLDKSLRQFGDQLYIRHTPTMQQEGTLTSLQILLIQC